MPKNEKFNIIYFDDDRKKQNHSIFASSIAGARLKFLAQMKREKRKNIGIKTIIPINY